MCQEKEEEADLPVIHQYKGLWIILKRAKKNLSKPPITTLATVQTEKTTV